MQTNADTTRIAKCACCANTAVSSQNLPFFEDKTRKVKPEMEQCVCGYYRMAHDNRAERIANGQSAVAAICDDFTARPQPDHDTYYCGCGGWN